MITLLVNNQPLTTQPGEVIALQKAAAKIGKLQNRQGSFTNDFEIPATMENISALGFANMMDISGEVVRPSRRIQATLRQDSIDIGSGFLQIVSVDYLNRTIKVSFFGGLSDWVSKLSGISIRDIDLSDYDHTWDLATIQASFSNTEGYIYPLIDWGDLEGFSLGADSLFTEDFYPCLYQHTLIERAMSLVGYKVGGSFIRSFEYLKAIIPFAGKDFLSSPEFEATFLGSMTGQQLYQQTFLSPSTINDIETLIFTTKEDNDYGNFNVVTNTFTAEKNETFEMRLEVDIANFQITNTGGAGADISDLSIQARTTTGTSVLAAQEILSLTGTGTTSTSGKYVFEFEWTATAGEQLRGEFVFNSTTTTATSVQYIAQFTEYTLHCDGINRTMQGGDTVELAYTMPDIPVLDVIRDMMQRHGLIATTNEYTQTVSFEQFERAVNFPALDWSDKVDHSRVQELNFTDVTRDYAKKNYFRYAASNDDDTLLYDYDTDNTEALGTGSITIDNEWLSTEQDIYQSMFKACYMHDPFSENPGWYLPVIRRYGYGQSIDFDPGPRILYVLPNQDIDDITAANFSTIRIGGTLVESIPYAYFYKRETGSDIDNIPNNLIYGPITEPNVIGSNLIADHYRALTNILNNGRLVEISIQLREHEFVNLDFATPVRIDSGPIKGLFFVDEVLDYEGGRKPCRVKLIEIDG